jgi:hypothetical protein
VSRTFAKAKENTTVNSLHGTQVHNRKSAIYEGSNIFFSTPGREVTKEEFSKKRMTTIDYDH